MSWGSWILILIYPAGLLLGLGSLEASERAVLLGWVSRLRLRSLLEWVLEWGDGQRKLVLWGSVVAGVALGVYTGLLLGTLSARPQWDSAVLGPLFLSSGLSTGAACLLLFSLHPEERHWLVRWDLVAIGAELFFIGAMLVGFAAGDRAAQYALHNLTTGPWGGPFWVLVVLLGLLVPVAMDVLEIRRRLPPIRVTPALILIGGLSLRWILVDSGQASNFSVFP
jgi:formate-dependent nitrite reductase membrane component NrfD